MRNAPPVTVVTTGATSVTGAGAGAARAGQRGMGLRTLHRASALALALFLGAHLLGHLAGLAGADVHQAVLEVLRQFYRNPWVEPLLLCGVLFQVCSGSALLLRGWRLRRGAVAWAQALSGAYLALFLSVHVGAVLLARQQGVDTNLQFAAAGMHRPPWQWFFGPYYFLAVLALSVHVGCALYWNVPRRLRVPVLTGVAAAGLLLAATLVVMLAGGWQSVAILLARAGGADPIAAG